jgi:hypothetical protein
MGSSDFTNNLLMNPLLNFNITDIKDLMHIGVELSAYHDIMNWQKADPNGIVIQDRTWLTVLVYLGMKPYSYIKRGHLLSLLKPLMSAIKQPDITYMLTENFKKERVKSRSELKDYYANFDAGKIGKRYKEFINWMIFSLKANFEFFEGINFETLDARNKFILNDMLKRIEKNILEKV